MNIKKEYIAILAGVALIGGVVWLVMASNGSGLLTARVAQPGGAQTGINPQAVRESFTVNIPNANPQYPGNPPTNGHYAWGNQTLTVPGPNPNMGPVRRIVFAVQHGLEAYGGVENLDNTQAVNAHVVWHADGIMGFFSPSNTLLGSSFLTSDQIEDMVIDAHLSAYDGTTNYSGTSGTWTTHTWDATQHTTRFTVTDPVLIAEFTGTNVSVRVQSITPHNETSNLGFGGFAFGIGARGQFTVTYEH